MQRGAAHFPKKGDWGSDDEKLVKYYTDANFAFFYIRDDLTYGTQTGSLHGIDRSGDSEMRAEQPDG